MKDENTEIVRTSDFVLMEAADNAQIVAEINGEMLGDMVYTVKGKSRLSYAGAKFAAIKLGNIHVRDSEVSFNVDLDQWEASALAYNGEMNITLPGYAEQPRLRKEKGEMVPNEFARRTAVSKAVRNALMAVMPADHIAAYMKAAIDGGKGKKLGTTQAPPRKQVKATVKAPTVGPAPRKESPKPAAENPPEEPEGPPRSLQEVEDRLRENVVNFEGTLKLGEREDSYRIYKQRNMPDDEFDMIRGWIAKLGGKYSKEENCWIIPKEDS